MDREGHKIRAGIAEYNEETKLCTPIAIQGEIKIQPNEEEEELGFYDFEWRPLDKLAGKDIEPISLILIPGETNWVPIKSSKNGRIFALVFSSNQRYFFWFQKKNPANMALDALNEEDQKFCDAMNAILHDNLDESEEENENQEKPTLIEDSGDINMD
ncbi:hypothetical protein NCAS_0J01770 [Naumovozyma castellii]|uniref:Pru domain-containing protein n=1 Tax=Naumovozyma castellii TaxID=27288 RepID=G0VKW8_NAUCA|nr:hypothetical protein NCAS_0J01770 [Naumovozyma castellii CBS 4309]CCC72156.1 hypothetical protein NCAS_0J01770 [Naumovozyma castellii CBS 4309]